MRRPQQPHILFGGVTRAAAEILAVVPFVVGKTRGSLGSIGHYTERYFTSWQVKGLFDV